MLEEKDDEMEPTIGLMTGNNIYRVIDPQSIPLLEGMLTSKHDLPGLAAKLELTFLCRVKPGWFE